MIQILGCDPASVFVPNTFTPNGDGTNDKLYVRSKTLAQLEYFRLFNRWGAIVYESKSMSDGWDGSINGKLAEQGVYVYQVSGKCESGYDIATSGTVTLIR
jgi:gliding motility-associated-like protein